MNKEQLRDMRAILQSEANGTAFPKLTQSMLSDLLHHTWIEATSAVHVYKSTRHGREAYVDAMASRDADG